MKFSQPSNFMPPKSSRVLYRQQNKCFVCKIYTKYVTAKSNLLHVSILKGHRKFTYALDHQLFLKGIYIQIYIVK
jgi:hypothetical protein